jgi:hypothetical protein
MFPPVLRTGWHKSRTADGLLPRLGQAFANVYCTDTWVWKDPRLALTLPIWRRILPSFCVVLVIRNPSSVTGSLRRRDGFSLAYCHALWDRYNRSATAVMSGLPVVILNFDNMIADPVRWVTCLAADLKECGVQIGGNVEDAVKSLQPDSVHRGESAREDFLTRGLWQQMQGLPRASLEFKEPSFSKGPVWVDAAIRLARVWSRLWW